MAFQGFVDYYEVLQVSPNASAETVERVYRLLAKRYHPDNPQTGDPTKFGELQKAFETLSDPTERASYDVVYDEQRSVTWQVFQQSDANDRRAEDRRLFHAVLSLLYAARRRDPDRGGIGSVMLERMLNVPQEHLQFPLWYLRQKGWVERLETGYLAITVDGIDKLEQEDRGMPEQRLLTAPATTRGDREPASATDQR